MHLFINLILHKFFEDPLLRKEFNIFLVAKSTYLLIPVSTNLLKWSYIKCLLGEIMG